MNRLFEQVRRKQVNVARVAEIGVYCPHTSHVIDFINAGVPAILVEADPKCVKDIRKFFETSDVMIYPFAIWDDETLVTLYRVGASTFVSGIETSPAKINDGYTEHRKDAFQVQSKRFSSIDPGDIDLISIDVEGAEWYVLKHMVSRPAIISLELRAGKYKNPFSAQINSWLANNQYRLWYHDDTDSVYYRSGLVTLTSFERLALAPRNCRVNATHFWQRITR